MLEELTAIIERLRVVERRLGREEMFDLALSCFTNALDESLDAQKRLATFAELLCDLALREHLITPDGYDNLVAKFGTMLTP